MELIKIITITLCIILPILQSSNANANQVFMPRKLKVITAKEHGDRDSASSDKPDGATIIPGAYHNEPPPSMVNVKGGKIWVDETDDTSEFITMDYLGVRKRRPIHNKSFAP